MTDPTPAQRAGWFAQQHEARYGQHRPSPRPIGTSWRAGCGCADVSCTRGEDVWDHPTFEAALDASRINIAASEHGPGAGQETP